MMRKFKGLLAAILTAALMASLTVLPAGAAGSFSDIHDDATAVNADILRLMGVVSGVGNNQFNPGGSLTRAQFCTMAVKFLQRDREARQYATRTIFSDVPSSHWARQYVNLAASIPVTEGSGEGAGTVYLVAGVGDGTFKPDQDISMAEATTILLRALGYSSKQAGAVWPQGYLDLAASIGLTDDVDAGPYSSITRAQAAQLFVNALSCKKADGTAYYKSIGTVAPDKAIILAVNVTTDDGSGTGAVRTTNTEASEAYLPASGSGNVPALQGKRGDLVLNDRDEIVAFVPDDSTAITITLSGDAQAAYLKASGGRQYTVSSDTKVYTSASGEGRPYLEGYTALTSGTQVTMYSEKGKIVAVYSASGGTTVDSDAVVVMGTPTTATFHQLTGGVTNFKIIKNRQSISMSQIRPYDVATYDAINNTLVVSDLRLTAVYKDPAPTPKTPTSIKVAGTSMDVLSSAWDTIGDARPGDSVCLLLTADGKVAGIVKGDGQARSTAIGYVEGGKLKMFLPNGSSMELSGTVSNASNVDNQLVSISASRDGFYASRLSGSGAPGDFNVAGMKLGSYTVASGVRLYEQVRGGAMVEVNRGDLVMTSVPAGQIAGYHLNSSSMVDYIILSDVTGDAYEYGMMSATTTTRPGGWDEDDNPLPDITTTSWKLVRGGGDIEFISTAGYSGRSGDMVGVVPGTPMGEGDGKTIKAIIQLTEVKNVKPSDFFESEGAPYVTVAGRTYRVADDVECCHDQGSSRYDLNWLSGTGAARLASIKAYSDNLTIYVDPVGSQVRVIRAN